LHSSSFTISY